jgi:hypothetical protein
MSRFCLTLFCAFLVFSAPAAACEMQAANAVYQIQHDSFGTIGEERLQARCEGNLTIIERTVDVEVSLFNVLLHSRQANYIEIWRNQQLLKFVGHTDDNGEQSSIKAAFISDESLRIDVAGKIIETASTSIPTDPWHIKLIGRTKLFDRVDGHAIHATVIDAGQKQLSINGVSIASHKFLVSGKREQELWFERESGLWLKSKIKHPTGDIMIIRQNADVGTHLTMKTSGSPKVWSDARLD